MTQSQEREQKRADVWCRRKPCRALALRLRTERVQFQKRLADAVLNAVERAGLKTDLQAGDEFVQRIRQAIKAAAAQM